MRVTEIEKNIHQLSVNVKDILFEGLWEIPKGVSINSYVIKGESTALVDGVCGWDGVPESLFELLKRIDVDIHSIRYLILNHLEPDHAGFLDAFKAIHSDFEVICSKKGAELLAAFYDCNVPVRTVGDGDTLDLGEGRILTFKEIPNVHWPDSMMTYDTLSKTLFSCDAFGSFGIMEQSPFDDDYTDEELAEYEKETIRYYSNIIGAFSPLVIRAIDKCASLELHTIAPGHGLIWRRRLQKILTDYRGYATYHKGNAREEITLIWGSMYGNTELAVRAAIDALEESGIKYHLHQVPGSSWGDVLASAWTSSGLILAMPTYEYKMFPPMAAVLEELGKKKAYGRKVFRFGSYGWSGGAQKELEEIHEHLKLNWSFMEPYEFKGRPRAEDLEAIKQRVRALVEAVKGS